MQGASLPTAPFLVLDEPIAPDWPHQWPAFVKPACQDASVGISQGSVVKTPDELAGRVRHVFERDGGPVLVEQYIPGREFHVHVIEESTEGQRSRLRVMPAAEVQFRSASGAWPIYSYEAKWNESSEEHRNGALVSGVELEQPLRERVEEVCTAVYRLVGLRDYGRVDLRVSPEGHPYVLEVNPNPYLNSLLLVQGLNAMGQSFAEFVQGLVRNALRRGGA